MNEKSNLEKAELYQEDGAYYLRLKYVIENDRETYELYVPKVDIGLDAGWYPFLDSSTTYNTTYIEDNCKLILRSREFDVRRGNLCAGGNTYGNILFLRRIIDEKTKKMTVAEIEKKLGYKIEIVSEDKK